MPLAYVTGPAARAGPHGCLPVAMLTALLPAGLFYSEYVLTDAIYPVLVLGWLLAVHSWLTARVTARPVRGPRPRAPRLLARIRLRGAQPGDGHGDSATCWLAALVAWRRLGLAAQPCWRRGVVLAQRTSGETGLLEPLPVRHDCTPGAPAT